MAVDFLWVSHWISSLVYLDTVQMLLLWLSVSGHLLSMLLSRPWKFRLPHWILVTRVSALSSHSGLKENCFYPFRKKQYFLKTLASIGYCNSQSHFLLMSHLHWYSLTWVKNSRTHAYSVLLNSASTKNSCFSLLLLKVDFFLTYIS